MKARKNPNDEQLMRRLRRAPESDRDARVRNDPYWALRYQGFSHSHAIRAFRDEPPVVRQRITSDAGDWCDPDDLLFPSGSFYTEIEVAVRPLLTDETIVGLEARRSEYTVWDQRSPGFGVRVRSSGHKSFVVYCRPSSGKLRKHTIGKTSDFTVEQARQAAKAYRYAVLTRNERPDD